VAHRLTAGHLDLVTLSGWGVVSSFLTFLEELSFFARLDQEGTGLKRGPEGTPIPSARLILTSQVKIFRGIGSINLVSTKLFREIALLQLIGYTTRAERPAPSRLD